MAPVSPRFLKRSNANIDTREVPVLFSIESIISIREVGCDSPAVPPL